MTGASTVLALLRLARPYQWTKNGFVLAGLLFGHAWSQPDTLRAVLWMLAAFCLASSAVYVLNDLADLEADRRHPEKRLRPLASGALARNVAVLWSLLLALAACVLAALASQTGLALVLAYLFLNIGYSAGAKHVPVLDTGARARTSFRTGIPCHAGCTGTRSDSGLAGTGRTGTGICQPGQATEKTTGSALTGISGFA